MNGIIWICQNKTLGSEKMIGIYLSGTGNTKHCIEKLVGLIDNSAKVFPLEMPNLIEEIKKSDTIILGYPTQYSNAPYMVRDFIKQNSSLWKDKKIFCVAYLAGKKYSRARSDLHKKIAGIASVANIPEIQAQTDLINKVLNTDYVDTAGINEFEEIREKLRNLMKYLPNSSIRYDTNFTDEVLSTEWNESELENDDLKNYKAKAEYYIRQHQDNIAIAKLKRNKPLTSTDIAMLEEVLWSEVGTKQDYEQEFGEKPLGEFVREIVGLDMNAAKEAFSEYLTNASLDSRQIYFVNQIVEYIVHNGMMKDLSVLQESPFTDRGSVVEIFTDLSVWMGIRKVIDMINANAVA